MVHIRVVRASRLVLTVTSALFAAALIVLAARYLSIPRPTAAAYHPEGTAAVFSAASGYSGFTVEVMPPKTENPKRVLIYHTHTHEAYEQVPGDEYRAVEAWRTEDAAHSVVAVGEELKRCLEQSGISVVHDTTDHEPPKLGTAYVRSLETLEKYAGQPFDLYIDLHRDAWDDSMGNHITVKTENNEMATLMLLIGNGDGFEDKPDTQKNLAFAEALTKRLNGAVPGICRPVLVKSGRYNQHMCSPSVLIEVGCNKNTLPQALHAMPVLAQSIKDVLTTGNA